MAFKKSSILIELLISAAILSMALAAGVSFTGHYLQLMNYNKNKIIATYLAARELELVRWQRDTNFYQGKDWGDCFTSCINGGTALSHTSLPFFLDTDNKYNYSSGINTIFRGELNIINSLQDRVDVEAIVKWDNNQVRLIGGLCNW